MVEKTAGSGVYFVFHSVPAPLPTARSSAGTQFGPQCGPQFGVGVRSSRRLKGSVCMDNHRPVCVCVRCAEQHKHGKRGFRGVRLLDCHKG